MLQGLSDDDFTCFARGDIKQRDTFLSSLFEERGIEASQKSYLDAQSNGLLDDLFDTHGNRGSQGLPTIGVSRDIDVAEYFAPGPQQTQAGHVTIFKMKTDDFNKLAERNYENRRDVFDVNPDIGKPEQEYLFNTQIDSKYVVGQYRVATNSARFDNALFNSDIRQTQSASQGLIDAVSSRREVYIAKPGSDDTKLLEMTGADAAAGGPGNLSIIIKEKPQRLTLIEEFLHGT